MNFSSVFPLIFNNTFVYITKWQNIMNINIKFPCSKIIIFRPSISILFYMKLFSNLVEKVIISVLILVTVGVLSASYFVWYIFFFNKIMLHDLHFMQHMVWWTSNFFRVVLMLDEFIHTFVEKFCFGVVIDTTFWLIVMIVAVHALLIILSDQHLDFFLQLKQSFFRNFCIL